MLKIFVLPLVFAGHMLMAADIRTGKSIIITHPVYQDLYIAAGTILINAPVYGDLVVAGGTITINDSIKNDLLITGGSVTVNGYVADDARCLAGSLIITGRVDGEMFITGGTVQLEKSAQIKSLYVAGGEVKINGNVEGNVISRAGNLELDGNINGNVDLRGSKLAINGHIKGTSILAATDKIIINEPARFSRSIHYWQPFKKPLILPKNSTGQSPIYDPLLSLSHSKWYFLGASTFLGLAWYLGMAYVLILVIQYLFPVTLSKAAKSFHSNTVTSFLYGIGFFVITPLTIIIALVTVIGVPVAVILLVAYMMLLLLATITSSIVIANWAMYISNRTWSYWHITGTSLFVFILLKIIGFTPFFGWLVMMGIVFISYGAIIKNVQLKFNRVH